MARFEFRLPDIGEGIAEAEIVAWHVKVGDRIEEDQGVADMMTDKATVEMESPVSGVVVEVAGAVGDMIPIGSTLVVIEVEGEAAASRRRRKTSRANARWRPLLPRESQRTCPAAGRGTLRDQLRPRISSPHRIPTPRPSRSPLPSGRRRLASPAVRARAKDLGIDLAQVKAQRRRPHPPCRSRRIPAL